MAGAESFVSNPSFESNYNDEWPHYGPIDLWDGGSGTNQGDGPFHNAGTLVPDGAQVGFQQGSGAISQAISGLTAGTRYVVQFFYDARNCCGGTINLAVKIDDQQIKRIVNVTPQEGAYKFGSAAFTAANEFATLTFETEAQGDATLNFDGVSIIAREEGTLPIPNASFEASGAPIAAEPDLIAIAGWTSSGTVGILRGDSQNGATPDQNLVAGLSGASSISTSVDGLVPGESYDLEFAYNAAEGAAANLGVRINGESGFTEEVTAVGGDSPYKTAKATFTATEVSASIEFSQTAGGTLLLDDIKLAGAVAETFPPLIMDPASSVVQIGKTVQVNVTMPVDRQSNPNPVVVLRSANPEVASIVDADGDGTISLDFSDVDAGAVRSIQVEGVARGVVGIEVVDSAGLDLANGVRINVSGLSLVLNASFEVGELPGGVGYGAIPGWTGGSGVNNEAQPFLDNGTIPDRTRVAFLQGANTMSQEIAGLTPGQSYWLQFYYNARNCCGGTVNLSVSLADTELALIEDIQPVGDLEPFHFTNIPFVAPVAAGDLVFTTTAEGDATALLDAVTIVARSESDLLVRNPSFEVSLPVEGVGYIHVPPMGPGLLAGWEVAGGFGVNVDGVGPFTDNGLSGAQDGVLFLQGDATASQLITGLEPGLGYSLTYLINRRGSGEPNAYEVLIDDVSVFDEALEPAGVGEPYFERAVNFTARSAEARIGFRNLPVGDQTILLDDVRIKATVTNTSGLIARYPLDETEGSVMNDQSEFERNGSFEGSPVFGQDAIANGTSISFADGSFGSIQSRDLPYASLTISAWANLAAPGDRQTIFGQGLRNGEPTYAVIAGGTNLEFFIGAAPAYTAENVFTAGTNHHVTMAYDLGETSTLTLYVDGVAVISETLAEPLALANDTDFFFAAFFGALPMTGRLDDIQIYNRAVSTEEASFLHSNPGQTLETEESGEQRPIITSVDRTAEGIALQLPEGTTYDVEYSVDLITWEPIATDVTGTFVDSDAVRAGQAGGYYRGRVK
ncbi:MAG: LamG domain-containing protein [Verrucomicrobiota bacterium]